MNFNITPANALLFFAQNSTLVLLAKSMDWFLYDNGLRHERVKMFINFNDFSSFVEIILFSFNLQNTK